MKKIFLILLIFAIIKNIIMFLFCVWSEFMDNRYFKKRQYEDKAKKDEKKVINNDNNKKQYGIKYYIKKCYAWLYSYIYGLMRYNLIVVGKIPSHKIRHILYKYVYRMKIGRKTVIYGGCEIRSPWNITIGNAVISVGCILDGRQRITIGNNVVFGTGVHMWTEEHDLNDSYFRVTNEHSQPITIDDYAWICSDSTVLPGVHIKEGAVEAAMACVTKDCEPYMVYGGVPAKKISERNKNLKYTLSGKPTWHFY